MTTSVQPTFASDSVTMRLIEALGHDIVETDFAALKFFANDIFWQLGIAPVAIVKPTTAEQVGEAVRICAGAGVAMIPRGAGMSYSRGYLAEREGAVMFDMRGLDRILEIDAESLYVTVEAGCTWAALNEALTPLGLRTGYWGPLSGLNATVGGALSQNSAFFGSTTYGTVAESVLGIEAVLADGSRIATGSGMFKDTKPFTREGGADFTGLFLGDSGSFGLKVAATLRLRPIPAELGFHSFGFETLAAMGRAQAELARAEVVTEGFGIDRAKAEHSASVNKVSDALRTLGNVAKASGSLLKGARDVIGVAAAGTSFLKAHPHTLHLVVEGRDAAERDRASVIVNAVCSREGTEIENSIPKVMRSKPFGPLRGMLGRDGERWVPIHGIFPLGDAERVIEANEAFFAERADFLAEHGILVSNMTMTVGAEFFIEPAFYWEDEITPLHRETLGDEVVGKWLARPAEADRRAAVVQLRRETQQLYASLGGVNWQIARDYPYRERIGGETWAFVAAVKNALDPNRLMNPGALGL
jgi:D-lactate dehydrogenase (cytochrome)